MVPASCSFNELREKYVEMLRLRLEHEAGLGDDPRRAMAELAGRFPGSLREIDELPLDVIRSRIAALEAVSNDGAREQPWMQPIAMFHALMRGALCAKRWLAGKKAVDEDVARAFDREVSSLCYADDARAWGDELARVASPPRGRLTDLVFQRIAKSLGISDLAARSLVFGPPRRRRT